MPDFQLEDTYFPQEEVFGIDEAGRGPWCGPVVAGCVCWPRRQIPIDLKSQINDSKKLSPQRREKLYDLIMSSGALVGIGQASVQEIDNLNILQATFLAMRRALDSISIPKKGILIDGNRLPKWPEKCIAIIKGDSLSLSIAAASIVAKVFRDRLMQDLAKEYPQYGWNRNAGYGTAEHIAALQQYGITPHHRKSYAPIRALIEKQI